MTDTVELLQQLIRNRCVNDGTPGSGQEVRSAELLRSYLDGCGAEMELVEPAPGRASLIARLAGREPGAPSLALLAHTDVVPAAPEGWERDPFGGELVDGEVWGRGAIDMLCITASMAVAFRHLARTGPGLRGDLLLLAVADEEAGSGLGAQWLAENRADDVRTDYVLTETGGVHGGTAAAPTVSVGVAEKGVAWRRLRVRGESGHGSRPFRADNALVKAAAAVVRLAAYSPRPVVHGIWRDHVAALALDPELRGALLDPERIDDALAAMSDVATARYLHACTHDTMSPNVLAGPVKTNVIPDAVEVEVDIRILPGTSRADADAALRDALGDLHDSVEVEPLIDWPASASATDTPLWESIGRAIAKEFPAARPAPELGVGFTDARVARQLGATAYGAGLMSPAIDEAEFRRRFHGTNERVDVESLRLCTAFWIDVTRDLLSRGR